MHHFCDTAFIGLILLNAASFILMGIDKYKSSHNKWRISERTLFVMALLGGSAGVLCGMYFFHHKTRHKSFIYGIPIIILIQLLAAYYFYFYIIVL